MSRTVVNQELNEQEIRVNRENILIGGGAVNSVNGQTGDVVLTAQDVGAASTTELGNEVEARIAADNGLQSQIDGLAAASDVTDIVGTYADLQAYDTTKLKDNDIIKVLQDETHDDETTYYRWIAATSSFSLIGEEGPYYTKSAADLKFQDKLIAGSNITIDTDTNEISATDTTYTHFTGATASTDGTAGLVPAPTAADVDKFLKGDGTWATAGGGGSSTTGFRHLKLSEMTQTTISGTTYYSLPNGVDDLHAGWTYAFENDLSSSIQLKQICIVPYVDANLFGKVTDSLASGRVAVTTIYLQPTISSPNYYVNYISVSGSFWGGDSRPVGMWSKARIRVKESAHQTVYAVDTNEYGTSPIGLTNNYSSTGYGNFAFSASGAAAVYNTLKNGIYGRPMISTPSTTPLPWITLGTSSPYTMRSLLVTLNVKETGLTLTANDWNTLFIASKPAVEMIVGCTILDNGAYASSILKVTTDGEVQVMAGSNTTEVYGLVTIPVAS